MLDVLDDSEDRMCACATSMRRTRDDVTVKLLELMHNDKPLGGRCQRGHREPKRTLCGTSVKS